MLAESSAKPDSIASVAIQGFDLGKDPPRLRSVDVVDYGGSYSSSSRGGAASDSRLNLSFCQFLLLILACSLNHFFELVVSYCKP